VASETAKAPEQLRKEWQAVRLLEAQLYINNSV